MVDYGVGETAAAEGAKTAGEAAATVGAGSGAAADAAAAGSVGAGLGAGAAGAGAAGMTAAEAAAYGAAGWGAGAGAGAGELGALGGAATGFGAGAGAAMTPAEAASYAAGGWGSGIGTGTGAELGATTGAGLGTGAGAVSDFALETAAAEGLAGGAGAGIGAGLGAGAGGAASDLALETSAAQSLAGGAGASGAGLTPIGATPSVMDASSLLNLESAGPGGTAGLHGASSSVLPSLSQIPGGGTTAGLLASGLISNLAGNAFGAKQQKQNLSDYTNAVTWTPEKANTYLNATTSGTAGILGSASKMAKGTLAEQMASSGRGGGVYGAKANSITENMLNQLAGARNQALTTVSTPPNLSPAPFMAQTSPTAQSLQGLGGALGNAGTLSATAAMLKQLWPNMFAS